MAPSSFRFFDGENFDFRVTKLNDEEILIEGKCEIQKGDTAEDIKFETFDDFKKIYKKSSVKEAKEMIEEGCYEDEYPGFTDEEWLDYHRWNVSLEKISISPHAQSTLFEVAVNRLLRNLSVPEVIHVRYEDFISPNEIRIPIVYYEINECSDFLQKLSELRYV